MHRSLRKVGHRRSLRVLKLLLVDRPAVGCLLKLGNPLLKILLFSGKPINLFKRVLASEVFKSAQSLPQVFVFILKLEDLSILIVDKF